MKLRVRRRNRGTAPEDDEEEGATTAKIIIKHGCPWLGDSDERS